MKSLRCAVYTRKSSEEGLEQEFNSLDAQREAGEAYISSQVHEGWTLIPDRYDDGGISGGTLERPALQRLLHDVESDQIDVIVVYKIDRLTRSLTDFSRIVEIFDKHNVSFVSVTQQFNTTSSMGRLTLNILLSFAQFEREITGERIRDKIALSKQKGMWMGGYVPLGYDAVKRKLLVNTVEADLVHRIFTRFVKLGSTTMLAKELHDAGCRNKVRRNRRGAPFTKTSIYKILHNRIYLGEIRHKDTWYPGEHQPIVDRKLWDKTHCILEQRKTERAANLRRQTPAPLKGLLFGPDGKAMTPTHTRRRGKVYRYYITHTAQKHGHEQCPVKMVRAGEIEGIVFDQLKTIFNNPAVVVKTWKTAARMEDGITENDVREGLKSIAAIWDHLYHGEQARLLQLFIERITVTPDGIHIDIRTNGIQSLVMDLKANRSIAISKEEAA
ncbi:MAG: site-specific DNA recombinase [Parasphingorhabdus sp.]|jgi:site-specific DNA recombinase